MTTKRARKASNSGKSSRTRSNKKSKTANGPTAKQTSRNPFLPEGMTKPVFLYFIDYLRKSHQHASLSTVARLNKLSHRIATPKLYQHVRLPTTASSVCFFKHFNISRPKGSIQDLSASDPLLLDRTRQQLLRKAFLPTLIRHLDITIDVDEPEYHALATQYVFPSKYLFTRLETLHITSYGDILKEEVRAGKRRPAQHGRFLRLVRNIMLLCQPKHLRWIPLKYQRNTDRPVTVPFVIPPEERSHMRRNTWYAFLRDDPLDSYDFPLLDHGLSPPSTYRTVMLMKDPGDLDMVRRTVVALLKDLVHAAYKFKNLEDIDGPSIHIGGVPSNVKPELERLLRATVAENMAFRYVISEELPFQYDCPDEWREWLGRDVWGEKLVYPAQGGVAV